ncbi:MAG: hypothetical protein FJ088_00370, partial [Deltaproteobacteria bacterium]|nr:hypothetical protein [Deltaproteobacteria bacterium]
MRKRLFPAILFSFLLVLVSGYFLIPILIEHKIRTALDGLAENSGVIARFSGFHYGFFSTMEISGLEIETNRGISAEFEMISARFDPLSFLTSTPVFRGVDISGGLISIDTDKAKEGKAAGKEGKAASLLQRFDGDFLRKIPRIEGIGCSSLDIVFAYAPESSAVLSHGEFFMKDVSLERGRVKLEGAGSFLFPEEESLISGEFSLELPGFDASAEIRFEKRLVLNAGAYVFAIPGMSFESGIGLKFLSPIAAGNFPVNGLKEIEAEGITITSLKIGDILGSGRLPGRQDMEIEVTRPLFQFEQAGGKTETGKEERGHGIEGIFAAPLRILENAP